MIIYRVVRLGVTDEHFKSFTSKCLAEDFIKTVSDEFEGCFIVDEEEVFSE